MSNGSEDSRRIRKNQVLPLRSWDYWLLNGYLKAISSESSLEWTGRFQKDKMLVESATERLWLSVFQWLLRGYLNGD